MSDIWCEWCGDDLPNGHGGRRFCSAACRMDAWKENHPVEAEAARAREESQLLTERALRMQEYGDMTGKEIADELGLTEDAVLQRIARAKRRRAND